MPDAEALGSAVAVAFGVGVELALGVGVGASVSDGGPSPLADGLAGVVHAPTASSRARRMGMRPRRDIGLVGVVADVRALDRRQGSVIEQAGLAAQKLERVLTNDPATGVIRHVDAGYDIAERTAQEQAVRIPMREA